MKRYISKHILTIIGIMIGAIAGYFYYHFVGCASGTCVITAKPFSSTFYGATVGGLFLNMFQKEGPSNKVN